jgi:NH3-dependent NAD+ synthetase
MGFAQALGGIMINTGNKTERFTNNFTIYADSAGNIAPIADFDKDRVYEVALFINEIFTKLDGEEKIPASTIKREGSAELAPNQVDANVMGGRPEVIAPFLRDIVESGHQDFHSARAITPTDIPDSLIKRWVGSIAASEWKGRQITPATRVTSLSAGFNRRIPINHQWKGQLPS